MICQFSVKIGHCMCNDLVISWMKSSDLSSFIGTSGTCLRSVSVSVHRLAIIPQGMHRPNTYINFLQGFTIEEECVAHPKGLIDASFTRHSFETKNPPLIQNHVPDKIRPPACMRCTCRYHLSLSEHWC